MAVSITFQEAWTWVRMFNENGNADGAYSLACEIYESMPTLSLENAVECLRSSPEAYAISLAHKWVGGCDLTSYGLLDFHKTVKGMAPTLLVVMWLAWLRQNNIGDYRPEQIAKVSREIPPMVLREIKSARRLTSGGQQ